MCLHFCAWQCNDCIYVHVGIICRLGAFNCVCTYACIYSIGLNRLGLRDEPAPQPQHTLLSSPKKMAPTVGLEPTFNR